MGREDAVSGNFCSYNDPEQLSDEAELQGLPISRAPSLNQVSEMKVKVSTAIFIFTRIWLIVSSTNKRNVHSDEQPIFFVHFQYWIHIETSNLMF